MWRALRETLLRVAAVATLALAGCGDGGAGPSSRASSVEPRQPSPPSAPAKRETPKLAAYTTPVRSEAELDRALVAVCARAKQQDRPWLLEFSAVWCSDCLALQAMARQSPLRDELEHWPRLSVNIGRFDRHRDLLERLGVKSIARWVVLSADDCDNPRVESEVLAQRTLEPQTGDAVDPQDLATWLATLRTPPANE